MRMFVSGRGVLLGLLTMFVRRHGVLLRLLVLAEIVMMRGLVMMMGGGVVMSGGLVVMLARRMFRLCHGAIPPNRSWKIPPIAASIWGGFCSPQPCRRRAANRQTLPLDRMFCIGASKKNFGFAWIPSGLPWSPLDFPLIRLGFSFDLLGFPSPNRAFSMGYSDP
jgi:hypothetical protein